MDDENELVLRRATTLDVDALARISTGPIAGKRSFIDASLERRTVVVAECAGRIAGYIVWDHEFFGRAFVWLLGVDPRDRRRGIAKRLMEAFESACRDEPLFVSTNASNRAMHELLAALGYIPSGRVDNLDRGDPEMFYFKNAAKRAAADER